MTRKVNPKQKRPPQPDRLPCKNCGKPGKISWHKRSRLPAGGSWDRLRECETCFAARTCHGMTGPQRDAYLADGCSIPGCIRPAKDIDHDHEIHPQPMHSCIECRRGALCHFHNRRVMTVIDAIRRGDEEIFEIWEYANRLSPIEMTIGERMSL